MTSLTHTYTVHIHIHSHTHSLITDDDGSYLPRPEWAKATGASTIQIYGDTNDLHVDSTLSDLEEEALYISRDALEDFVPIGEGTYFVRYKINVVYSGIDRDRILLYSCTLEIITLSPKIDMRSAGIIVNCWFFTSDTLR